MAPDWIPRLSRNVGGRILACCTVLGMLMLDSVLLVGINLGGGAWFLIS